jgi:hypothetical protein
MALIACPECSREVSDRASACPHCGAPVGPQRADPPGAPDISYAGLRRWLAILVVVLMVGALVFGSKRAPAPYVPLSARAEPPPPVAPDPVAFVAERVTLDRRAREMEIRGVAVRAPGSSAPDTIWVWAYFTHPEYGPNSWSDASIAVVRPFAHGDTAHVVARGPYHWARSEYSPQRGYFARVTMSTVSGSMAQIHSSQRRYDVDGTIRVRTP